MYAILSSNRIQRQNIPMIQFTVVIAAALYSSIGFNQMLALSKGKQLPIRRTFIGLLLATVLATYSVSLTLFDGYAINIGVFSFIAATTVGAMCVILLASRKYPTASLGGVLSPITAIALLAMLLLPSDVLIPVSDLSSDMVIHIASSIVAFGFLINAAIQAALSAILNQHLHAKKFTGFVAVLPPLQTMEAILFHYLGLGVIALSIAIATGFLAYDDLFAQHLIHKTVLSIIAWLFFGGLFVGHKLKGWRGHTATRFTLIGFSFLTLGYIGSEFVLQYVVGH